MRNYILKQDAISTILGIIPGKFSNQPNFVKEVNEAILEGWIKNGRDIHIEKLRGRFKIDERLINPYINRISKSFVFLDKDDYKTCFEFAVEAYYKSITKADFNRGKQRDVGEFITNQVQGKLGELAVKELLKKYSVNIDIDLRVTGEIPSQDVEKISFRNQAGSPVWNTPSLKISIKSTKLKNIMLAIPEKEANIMDRKSDIYILSQVGLSQDHLLRFMKSHEFLPVSKFATQIPDQLAIPCRVSGWIDRHTLIKNGPMSIDEINRQFGVRFSDPNYIKTIGDLRNNWEFLIEKLK